MGKTMTKEQRKNSKYVSRDFDRRKKYNDMAPAAAADRKPKPKQKWRPHSEIEID